jgi:hypothetical protein
MAKNIYSGIPSNATLGENDPFVGQKIKNQTKDSVLFLKKTDPDTIIGEWNNGISLFAVETDAGILLKKKTLEGISDVGGQDSPELLILTEDLYGEKLYELTDVFEYDNIVVGNKALVSGNLYRYTPTTNEDHNGILINGFQEEEDLNGIYVRYTSPTLVGDRNVYYYNGEFYLIHVDRWMFVESLDEDNNYDNVTPIVKNSTTDAWSYPWAVSEWVKGNNEPAIFELNTRKWADFSNWSLDAFMDAPANNRPYIRMNGSWYEFTVAYEGDEGVSPYFQGNFDGQHATNGAEIYIWGMGEWHKIAPFTPEQQ